MLTTTCFTLSFDIMKPIGNIQFPIELQNGHCIKLQHIDNELLSGLAHVGEAHGGARGIKSDGTAGFVPSVSSDRIMGRCTYHHQQSSNHQAP